MLCCFSLSFVYFLSRGQLINMPVTWIEHLCVIILEFELHCNAQQERPLGHQKTLPAYIFSHLIFRLICYTIYQQINDRSPLIQKSK